MDVEVKARNMGWVPKEEWRGNPENWREAEEFIERGDYWGILKERQGKILEKNETLEGELKEVKGILKKTMDTLSKSDERNFEKAKKVFEKEKAQLKRDLKAAAKEEDWGKFDDIETQIDSLEEPEEPQKTEVAAPTPTPDPVFVNWKDRNKWYGTDMNLSVDADAIGQALRLKIEKGIVSPMSDDAFFDKVTKEIERMHPDKFKNPNRDNLNTVDGGNVEDRKTNKKAKTFNNLPAEVKAEYERLKEDFKVAGHEFTKEEYVKNYDWEE